MTLTLIGILGIAIVHNNGFTSRSAANPEIKFSGDIGHEEFYQYLKHNFYKCDPIDLRTQSLLYNDIVRCFQSKDGGKQDIAIIGDSHAEHMFIGLAENMKSNIVFYIKNSNPFYGNKDFTAIFDYIKKSESIKTVIISASWHGRLSEISSDMNLENLLFETAHQLEMANKRVYIADDIPTFSFDPKWCKFSRKLSHATNCSNERKYNDSEYEKYNPSIIGAITNLNNTKIMETYSYFCNDVECSMTTDHSLLYRDGGHLNISGSKFLGKKIISSYPELDKK